MPVLTTFCRSLAAAMGLALALGGTTAVAAAQTPSPDSATSVRADPERAARLKRQGAALRVGAWRLHDLRDADGVSASETPVFDGYFEKGLDLHLTLQSTLGVWSREVRATSGGLGGTDDEAVRSMVVPMFSALKMYPFTTPDRHFEPYAEAGLGVALGVENRNTTSGSLLGSAYGGSGTTVTVGYGFKAGAGIDWRLGRAFGVSLGTRYQWVRFDQPVGGAQLYRGLVLDGGLTYRFQY